MCVTVQNNSHQSNALNRKLEKVFIFQTYLNVSSMLTTTLS